MDKRAIAEKIKAAHGEDGNTKTIQQLCFEYGITTAVYQYYTGQKGKKGKKVKTPKNVPAELARPRTIVAQPVEPHAGKAMVIVVPMSDIGALLRGMM